MSADVSVVVPVYNAEPYLRKCIDSLIHQTLKSVELIFVDDGSTDGSAEIIEEYRTRDDRIKLIRQQNQYAGAARNNGMKQATGKYIIFLDADDFFKRTLLEKAFRCAEKNQAEIVAFGHYHYDDRTGRIKKIPFSAGERGVFSAEMLGDRVLSFAYNIPWNKMYLRSYIEENNLKFLPIYKHNDLYFTMLSMTLAHRIIYLKKRYIYYRINNSKSLQGKGDPSYPYLIECYTALKKALSFHGKFRGSIRNTYNKCVSHSIERRSRSKPEVMFSKQYYCEMKENLIPNLFDSPADFANDTNIPGIIYESMDYDHYVLLLVESMKDEMISKQSKDYILGHALLAVPRKIRDVISF